MPAPAPIPRLRSVAGLRVHGVLVSRRLFPLLLGVLATLLHAAAPAKEPADTHLHSVRLAVQGTLGDFYLLYGVDSDPRHAESIDRRITQVDKHLIELKHSLDGEPLQRFEQHWRTYAALLRQLSGELLQQHNLPGSAFTELIQLHDQLLEAGEQLATTPMAQERQLALLLQTIATRYIAYSIGANTLGTDEQSIDELAGQFSNGLQGLQQRTGQTEEYLRLLDAIGHTWRYIEPSLRNYQSAAIPSLVNRYATRIIQDLEQVHASTAARG